MKTARLIACCAGAALTSPQPVGGPPYKKAQVKELLAGTVFDEKELAQLGEMYRRYTTVDFPSIPVERMRDIPETSVFPLFQRVAQMQNDDGSGVIDFGEFVRAMSALSPKSTLEGKLKFVFNLFDMNKTGRLDAPELFQLLRMTMGTSHDDSDLQTICDGFLRRFPEGMDYDTFVQLFDVADINKLTLNL